MLDAIEVKIFGRSLGALIWNSSQAAGIFRFYKDFLKLGLDVAPLLIPLQSVDSDTSYSFMSDNEHDRIVYKGLPAFIADSLPDSFGNKVIDEWLLRQGRMPGSFSILERLCYTGERGIGALEFFPPAVAGENITDIDIKRLVQLAQEVFNSRANFNTHQNKGAVAMKDIIKVGVSAGGARPKAVIAYNDVSGEIKSGQVAQIPEGFQHWLIKLDGVTKSSELGLATGMGLVEYAYHLMAKDCGINMAECRILEEGGRAHFMTRRFDRPGNGEKLHLQTLNAIAGMNYLLKHTFSYEHVFSILRQLNLSYPTTEQFFRRMVFNVVAKNCDDHTKNISFLMNKTGSWSLSPAYDLTYAYDPTGKWNRDHFLSINGKYEDFKYADIEKIAKEQRIKSYKEIMEQIRDVVSRWREYAKNVGVENKIAAGIGNTHEVQAIYGTKPTIQAGKTISSPLNSTVKKTSILEKAATISDREIRNKSKNNKQKFN